MGPGLGYLIPMHLVKRVTQINPFLLDPPCSRSFCYLWPKAFLTNDVPIAGILIATYFPSLSVIICAVLETVLRLLPPHQRCFQDAPSTSFESERLVMLQKPVFSLLLTTTAVTHITCLSVKPTAQEADANAVR